MIDNRHMMKSRSPNENQFPQPFYPFSPPLFLKTLPEKRRVMMTYLSDRIWTIFVGSLKFIFKNNFVIKNVKAHTRNNKIQKGRIKQPPSWSEVQLLDKEWVELLDTCVLFANYIINLCIKVIFLKSIYLYIIYFAVTQGNQQLCWGLNRNFVTFFS